MTSFVVTPANISVLPSIYRDPITGRWVFPVLTFDVGMSPFLGTIDPLHNDQRYQKKVIENIHLRLTEKWLYSYPAFDKLCKYFMINKESNKGTVSLINDPDKLSTGDISDDDRKYIFKFIEKFFISKKFVDKVLRSYINSTHTKWYDIFHNTDSIKDLFVHKLKKLIVNTVIELQKRSDK